MWAKQSSPSMPAALLSAQPADTIYYHCMAARPVAETVAIRGNCFIAVGSKQEVLSTAGTSSKKVDLLGRTVVPG
jgi:predicted amidohydrolase YtcJ